jgi:hypothetical protein
LPYNNLIHNRHLMKVKELIEILKTFPEDLEVVSQWRDVEYGLDISQDIDVYKSTVKKTPGWDYYTLGALTQYGKELPSTDVEVLIIGC